MSTLVVACSPSAGETWTTNVVAGSCRFPKVEVAGVFEPPGESNVRSTFQLTEGVGLIGTEETGDIFKSEDAGMTWRKVWDGGDSWKIQDVRNFIRAADGFLYITTSEPALVARSMDEGESWSVLARPRSSRTVGLVELQSGVMLAGLRRSENGWTSIVRSEDAFSSFDWIPLSTEEPRQNVTCFGYWGGREVLAGVGYEGSGKIYRSMDEGKSWVKTADFPEARDLMNFVRIGDRIFVLASGIATLFQSTDGGQSWTPGHQFFSKGFLGQCASFEWEGDTFWLLTATDQTRDIFRHVVMISDDSGDSWSEWIQLAEDSSGGASNLAVLSPNTIVVGTGNHSAQGRAFTLLVTD
ncbi:MAG: hypothetical protein R3F07_15025 [Opitutaceae bacterium]